MSSCVGWRRAPWVWCCRWSDRGGWLRQSWQTVSREKEGTAGANGLWAWWEQVGLLSDTGERAPSLLAQLSVVSVLLTNMQRKTAKLPEREKIFFRNFSSSKKSYILVELCKICIITFFCIITLSAVRFLPLSIIP